MSVQDVEAEEPENVSARAAALGESCGFAGGTGYLDVLPVLVERGLLSHSRFVLLALVTPDRARDLLLCCSGMTHFQPGRPATRRFPSVSLCPLLFSPQNDEPKGPWRAEPSRRLPLIMCAKPLGVIWQPLKSFVLAYFSLQAASV